jgi:hypothetical protein
MRAINLLAEDINAMYEETSLSLESKYHETLCFLNEMIRAATGLAYLEDEVMSYGCWE